MILGWTFLSPILAHIDGKITLWILRNLSLTLRDTWEKLQKLSVTKIYSVGFHHKYWTVVQKMNSRDKAILKKFCVKESSNLIDLECFGPAGFSVIAVLGCLPPLWIKKWPNLHVSEFHTNFLHSSHESLTQAYYYLKWEIKV